MRMLLHLWLNAFGPVRYFWQPSFESRSRPYTREEREAAQEREQRRKEAEQEEERKRKELGQERKELENTPTFELPLEATTIHVRVRLQGKRQLVGFSREITFTDLKKLLKK